jgi:hypothetical protein
MDKRSLDINVDEALRFLQNLPRHINETCLSCLTKTRKMLNLEKKNCIYGVLNVIFFKSFAKWDNMCHKCTIIG